MRILTVLAKPAVLMTCVAVLSTGLLSGCASTNYGQGFTRDAAVANQFRFKIYASLLTTGDAADKKAKEEIDGYAAKNNMASGAIVSRTYTALPVSYYEYTVKFTPR